MSEGRESVEKHEWPKCTIASLALAWLAVTSSMQHSPYELLTKGRMFKNKVALKENKQRWRLSLKCSVEVPTCQQEHRLVCLAYQQLGLPLKALYQVP